jgi:hypothetical protein
MSISCRLTRRSLSTSSSVAPKIYSNSSRQYIISWWFTCDIEPQLMLIYTASGNYDNAPLRLVEAKAG